MGCCGGDKTPAELQRELAASYSAAPDTRPTPEMRRIRRRRRKCQKCDQLTIVDGRFLCRRTHRVLDELWMDPLASCPADPSRWTSVKTLTQRSES